MDFEEERERIAKFLKVGVIVLSVIVVFSLGVKYVPEAMAVSAGANRKLPIYCVDTQEPKVSISFDAAWGNEQTQGLLDCLAKYKVKATFFATGGWVEKYPGDVKNIIAAGHDFGNHSETHKQMSRLNREQIITEIKTPHEKVKQLTGYEMTLFRPPFGDYNNTLVETCNGLGYHCIQWDVDTLLLKCNPCKI